MTNSLYERLAAEGIYGPGSKELEKREQYLTRYFEREYKRHIGNPTTVEATGIRTDQGPMMEETEALMEAHYNERPEFFSSFLDNKYRAYSMAYYGEDSDEIIASTKTLEEAQHDKFSIIAERAEIKGNERILNIGCGFGSLETYLFDKYSDLEIVGITPSKVQSNHIKQRIVNPNDVLHHANYMVIEDNFNSISTSELGICKYDIVISVAVFEQALNMSSILEKISTLLKPGGRSFHHFITSKITIPQFINPRSTKIGDYFPGGRVWPHEEFSRHTKHLEINDIWFINGLNYWRTLEEWHIRFWNNLDSISGLIFSTKEIKHWNEYFSLCKAVFYPNKGCLYGNSHYLFRKPL